MYRLTEVIAGTVYQIERKVTPLLAEGRRNSTNTTHESIKEKKKKGLSKLSKTIKHLNLKNIKQKVT